MCQRTQCFEVPESTPLNVSSKFQSIQEQIQYSDDKFCSYPNSFQYLPTNWTKNGEGYKVLVIYCALLVANAKGKDGLWLPQMHWSSFNPFSVEFTECTSFQYVGTQPIRTCMHLSATLPTTRNCRIQLAVLCTNYLSLTLELLTKKQTCLKSCDVRVQTQRKGCMPSTRSTPSSPIMLVSTTLFLPQLSMERESSREIQGRKVNSVCTTVTVGICMCLFCFILTSGHDGDMFDPFLEQRLWVIERLPAFASNRNPLEIGRLPKVVALWMHLL